MTPMAELGGRAPSVLLAALAAWMHFFGEPILGASESWYLVIREASTRSSGSADRRGGGGFALLMVSRRRGEKDG